MLERQFEIDYRAFTHKIGALVLAARFTHCG